MSKLALAVLLAVFSAGCAVKTDRGFHFFIQRGIVLNLVHTCTAEAMVFSPAVKPIKVVGPTPTTMPFEPPVFGGQNIQVTVQSLDENGHIRDTYIASFHIDYESTKTVTWVIGHAQVSGGGILYMDCNR